MGFPQIDAARQKAGYLPMDTFPIEGEPLPEGYNGYILFLDEANSAPTAVQAAAYKIILDRKVGQHHLHKNCAVVAAGNLETDNAIVQTMSTALQSRMAHVELVSDLEEWLDWAYEHGIDHRITSYVKYKPDNLYAFNPDHTDRTYACNRTWEFANRVINVTEDDDPDRLPMLAGTLSEGVAREFTVFCKIEQDLPKIPQIVQNPLGITVPREPSILYALTGAIGHYANKDNIGALMQFVNRLPKEFQVVTLRETMRRKKELLQHESVRNWVVQTGSAFF